MDARSGREFDFVFFCHCGSPKLLRHFTQAPSVELTRLPSRRAFWSQAPEWPAGGSLRATIASESPQLTLAHLQVRSTPSKEYVERIASRDERRSSPYFASQVNLQTTNQYALHTTSGCTATGTSANQSGNLTCTSSSPHLPFTRPALTLWLCRLQLRLGRQRKLGVHCDREERCFVSFKPPRLASSC